MRWRPTARQRSWPGRSWPVCAQARAPLPAEIAARVDEFARELHAAGPAGLVLCGSDVPAAQLLTALANALLGNASTTAVLDERCASRRDELALDGLVTELAAGSVGALVVLGANPALVDRRFAAALPAVAFSLSTSERLDETAALATVHAPQGHFLETWTDHQPRPGIDVMGQPCVAPLFDTRAETASLLTWSGAPSGDDHGFLQARWRREVLTDASDARWDSAVRDGVVTKPEADKASGQTPALVRSPAAAVTLLGGQTTAAVAPDDLQLVLHASVALHDGTGPTANNGWLRELPDPISKISWGNVAAIAPSRAAALGLADGDVVEVRTAGGQRRAARARPARTTRFSRGRRGRARPRARRTDCRRPRP